MWPRACGLTYLNTPFNAWKALFNLGLGRGGVLIDVF
jgi:hypothetical protein